MHFRSGCIRGRRAPCWRRPDPCDPGICAETLREPLKKSDARPNRERGITAKDLARESNARGLATAGQKIFAEFDEALGARRRFPAPVARKQVRGRARR